MAQQFRRYDRDEIEQIRQEYEAAEDHITDIADRYGTTAGSLRQMAHRRGWKRPSFIYRKGVPRKEIPPSRYEATRLMWEAGDPPSMICRYLGMSENACRDRCNEAFGYRNLREMQWTHFKRRNRQMYNLRKAGVSIAELCDMYWLGERSVKDILRKQEKILGKLPKRIKPKSIDEAKEKVLDEEFLAEIERHEKFLLDIIQIVCDRLMVSPAGILSNTRGTKKDVFARQIAAYIMHVEAGLSYARVGMLFGRDRSTIAYTARRVEDYRDDFKLDEDIDKMAEEFLADLKANHDFVSPYELYFST